MSLATAYECSNGQSGANHSEQAEPPEHYVIRSQFELYMATWGTDVSQYPAIAVYLKLKLPKVEEQWV